MPHTNCTGCEPVPVPVLPLVQALLQRGAMAMPDRMLKSLSKREEGLLPISDPGSIIDPRSFEVVKRAGCQKEECHRG